MGGSPDRYLWKPMETNDSGLGSRCIGCNRKDHRPHDQATLQEKYSMTIATDTMLVAQWVMVASVAVPEMGCYPELFEGIYAYMYGIYDTFI